MPRLKALTPQQMHRAAELYREGKSRRQIAAILRVSEMPVRNALSEFGIRARPQAAASASSNKARAGFYRKSQRVQSVFHLAERL